jgi:aldoxime dehydratase
MKRSRPDSYKPPYPAYQAHQPETHKIFVMAMFGVQAAPGANGSTLVHGFLGLCAANAPGKPLHTETAWHKDIAGYRNDVLMPYWRTPEDMAAFWARGDVAAFLAADLPASVGWWREALSAATTSLDGNYAIPHARYGISRYSEMKEEQFHGYMGSMRDRVPDYLAGKADGKQNRLTPQTVTDSQAKRLKVTGLPHNLCFIRGAFAWNEADSEEQTAFMKDMMPVYAEGSVWLAENPIESNCISMRMVEEIHLGFDNGVQSEVLGWFLTLADLEGWTREHPRHLAIMRTIMGYMQRFNFKPKLNLGHEVIVVPEGQLEAEYRNCHAQTGFLPFFPAHEVS